MARRASSSVSPIWIIVLLVLVAGALGGGFVLFGRVSDPYRTMAALPVQDYLQNANSLSGNVYKLDATIQRQLDFSATGGRLFSVDTPGGELVPILVPPEFSSVNIERGQRFLFKIEVREKGLLRAQAVKKA